MNIGEKRFDFRHDKEPLGVGVEKTFYQDTDNSDRVIGYYKEGTADREVSPRERIARFYLTKIMHILFPQNIPDIHMSTSSPHAIMRKKVEFSPNHDTMRQVLLQKEQGKELSPELARAYNTAGEKIRDDPEVKRFAGVLESFGVDVDHEPQDFSYDTDGNIIYVEPFDALRMSVGGPRPWFDADKLEHAIKGLDEARRQEALNYLQRLKKLVAEEITELQPKT